MTTKDMFDEEVPVVNYEVQPVDVGVPSDPRAWLRDAEVQLADMQRIKSMALQVTDVHDWVLQYGKNGPVPYLQASGCEKIRPVFGIRITGVSAHKYRDEAGDYVWEYAGTFTRPNGDSMEIIGSRSSGDPFFKGQSSISERDVKMAAYSNLMVNGITRFLGLRNISMEMLERAGKDPSKMGGIKFRQQAPEQVRTVEVEGDAGKKLYDLMVKIMGTDLEEVLATFLENVTAFTDKDGQKVPGVRSMKKMSARRIQVTLGKLRDDAKAGKYPGVKLET